MSEFPTLKTDRLIIRPFELADAPTVQELAGDWELAYTTVNIPHPYEDGMAEKWISTHQEAFEEGKVLTLAVVNKSEGDLIGAIGLHINQPHRSSEMGYWIGLPYWNQGYCTEAAWALLRHGFKALDLNRIQARHLTRNPASGRVMQKLGMQHEGTHRQAIFRWEKYEDVEMYAILREDFINEKG